MMQQVKAKFKIIFTKDANEFLRTVDIKVKEKILYNINKSMYIMDKELFKKLGDTDIWEFRTSYNGMTYRLLSFWDTVNETLVIATHGFVKKTQKTPNKEITKAENIRRTYFNSKK